MIHLGIPHYFTNNSNMILNDYVVQDSIGVEKQTGYEFLPKIERNLIELSISHAGSHDEGSWKRSLASPPIRLHLYFDQSLIWNRGVWNDTFLCNDIVFLSVERHSFFMFYKIFSRPFWMPFFFPTKNSTSGHCIWNKKTSNTFSKKKKRG